MYGLATDTECGGDGLPTPSLLARVRDVDGLQPFLQPLQGAHRAQSHRRVDVVNAFESPLFDVRHSVKLA